MRPQGELFQQNVEKIIEISRKVKPVDDLAFGCRRTAIMSDNRKASIQKSRLCLQSEKAVVTLPAQIGDVVIKNLLGTGVDVVVTANMD